MSANFVGKYQRTSAEKYEEFLAALGVNYLLRKAATVSTPVMEVRLMSLMQFNNRYVHPLLCMYACTTVSVHFTKPVWVMTKPFNFYFPCLS